MSASIPFQAYLMLLTVPFAVLQLYEIRDLVIVDERAAQSREPPLIPPLVKPVAFLLASVTFSAWMWTDQAEAFARSEEMLLFMVLLACTTFVGMTVRGLWTGKMSLVGNPMSGPYCRRTQPIRFWAGGLWNLMYGVLAFWLAYVLIRNTPSDACVDPPDEATVEQTVAACDDLLAKDTLTPIDRSHYLTGRAYALLDIDNDRAFSDLNQALERDRENGWAYRLRGYIRLTRRQFEAADADLTEGIRIQPKRANPYFDRARARASLGRMNAAMADVNQAIALDPTEGDHFQLRAEFERAMGQTDLAARDFAEAKRLRSAVVRD